MSTNSSLNLSTFPPDALLCIFSYVCVRPEFNNIEDDSDRRPAAMKLDCISATSPEIVLSSVCSLWRELMLSTPTFWTVIRVGTPGSICDVDEGFEPAPNAKTLFKQKELLDLWVKRSNGLPLSFVVRLEREAGNLKDRIAASTLVKAVQRQFERWEFLYARCHAFLMSMLSSLVFSHRSSLRQVDLTQTGPTHHPILSIWPILDPVLTPNRVASTALAAIKLRGGLVLEMASNRSIGTNLTCFTYHQPPPHLESSPMTFNDAFLILASCKSLSSFDFVASNNVLFINPTPDSLDWGTKGHVLLLGLKHLSLSSTRNLEFGPLLSILAAPDLEELSLAGPFYSELMAEGNSMNFDSRKDWNHVETFLKRTPASKLVKLYLEGIPLSVESVEEALRVSPLVEDFKLDGRMLDSHVVSRLTWIPGGEKGVNLLPKLKYFIVVGCSTTYVSVAELVHMVYSRARYASLLPIVKDDNWVYDEQYRLWEEDNGPETIQMAYIADTNDDLDTRGSEKMQQLFFGNPIIQHLINEECLGVCVDAINS
ncbi:hypothetical protein SCHPADRAFT_999064 [Schizopora paradoxa]|uniref:F-box domain-containing protein n=1 Tax=Schizopora paradoxa TaxID=27342 RepID=A0A0H2RHY3_9AGAM|nr:hypothetical protein SCHPADRAFT_999064 [Schizopora paradoxa]